MTSPTRGVPVELDRTRYLRFSLGTVRQMREKFGNDVLDKGVPADAVAELLWYGLKHEDTELTVEAVEEMVDLEHLDIVMKAVSKATGQEGKEPAPPAPEPEAEEPTPDPKT